MSEVQEQAYGQEGVQRSLGYVPADVPMPAPEELQAKSGPCANKVPQRE
jgi:hypothetical protein